MSPKVPEAAVAYAEQAVEDVLGRHGLRLKEPMRFGVWSGRESDYLGYQDVVLAVKE
jgi:hypothetical protein